MIDADDALAAGIEPADDPCFDLAIIERHQSRGSASPDRQSLAALIGKPQQRCRIWPRPGDRADKRNAVLVGADPLDNGQLGKLRPAGQPAIGGARDSSRALDLAQYVAECRPLARSEIKSAGDLALADRGWALADERGHLARQGQRAFRTLSPVK